MSKYTKVSNRVAKQRLVRYAHENNLEVIYRRGTKWYFRGGVHPRYVTCGKYTMVNLLWCFLIPEVLPLPDVNELLLNVEAFKKIIQGRIDRWVWTTTIEKNLPESAATPSGSEADCSTS